MMRFKNARELILPSILLILLGVLVDPTDSRMPEPIEMGALTVLVVLFSLYVVLIWRERAADEREDLHKHIAARFAYLAGTIVLVAALIVQGLSHTIDVWIAIALGVMVVAKALGRIYGSSKF